MFTHWCKIKVRIYVPWCIERTQSSTTSLMIYFTTSSSFLIPTSYCERPNSVVVEQGLHVGQSDNLNFQYKSLWSCYARVSVDGWKILVLSRYTNSFQFQPTKWATTSWELRQ